GSDAGVGCDKRLMSPQLPGLRHFYRGYPTLLNFEGWDLETPAYRFACPRANFLTLCFFDPRAYSRGLSGCSVLRFLRAARFDFLRSSLLNVTVFAMIAFLIV